MTQKLPRRVQVALAHLHCHGKYDASSFPLGWRTKYLGEIATQVRYVLEPVNATVTKFTLPDGTVGYAMVPFEREARTEAIYKALGINGLFGPEEMPKYFSRELDRLDGLLPTPEPV